MSHVLGARGHPVGQRKKAARELVPMPAGRRPSNRPRRLPFPQRARSTTDIGSGARRARGSRPPIAHRFGRRDRARASSLGLPQSDHRIVFLFRDLGRRPFRARRSAKMTTMETLGFLSDWYDPGRELCVFATTDSAIRRGATWLARLRRERASQGGDPGGRQRSGSRASAECEDVDVGIDLHDASGRVVARLRGDAIAADEVASVATISVRPPVAIRRDPASSKMSTGGAPPVEQHSGRSELRHGVRPLGRSARDRVEDLTPSRGSSSKDPPGLHARGARSLGACSEKGGVVLLALGPAKLARSSGPLSARSCWSDFGWGDQ